MTDHTSSPSTATDDRADADDSHRDGGRWFGNSEAIAETLGLTTDELHEARDAGLTIAEIATALSVDVAEVVQTILEDKAQRLEEKVAASRRHHRGGSSRTVRRGRGHHCREGQQRPT